MHFDYSLTPKTAFQGLTEIHKKNAKHLFHVVPLEITIFGSKSSQIASIFREKNDGGLKNIFLMLHPLKIHF